MEHTRYRFPIVELHLHLDGSFRFETVWELAEKQGVKLPAESLEDYKAFIRKCADARSVNEFLKMFDAPLLVMQDRESLARITKELIEDLDAQGHALTEIRFAPQLHCQKGMSQSDAVEAVLEGRRQAYAEGVKIKAGFLTCMMAVGSLEKNYKENMETVEVCRKYLGKGVVGLDLAGAEGFIPLSDYHDMFDLARKYHLPMTCHAGDSQGPDTVRDAMDFGVTRIGHGHHLYEDPALVREAAGRKITLEICPTSNIQCQSRKDYPDHPAKNLLEMGVPVTINTDNMTLSGVTLDDEYEHCLKDMGFEEKDLVQMNLNAVNASFLPEDDKAPVRKELETILEEYSR
ncbi:MAG: adenosine deaminase [Bulleidia sp.]|nr:adenosine deaminase [Bulleidia sp.]